MHKAIMSAYDGVLSPGYFPLYILFLEVDPQRLDVNIHPTKVEAKFEEDQAIFAILRSAVKRGLGRHHVAPSLDFETELAISIDPMPSSRVVSEPKVKINPDYNPFAASSSRGTSASSSPLGFGAGAIEELNLEVETSIIDATQAPEFFQFAGRFIITTKDDALVIIDARRAHQRILFEQYLSEGKGMGSETSQKLLFPEPLTLAKADTMLLLEASGVLKVYGLDIEEVEEGGAVEVIAVPIGMAGKLQDCIDAVLEALKDGTWADEEGRREKLAMVWAQAASIPKTKILTEEGISSMIGKLFACTSPAVDPWGRNVYEAFTAKSIEEKLG
jgi:DNA mismatch repair protein MutL